MIHTNGEHMKEIGRTIKLLEERLLFLMVGNYMSKNEWIIKCMDVEKKHEIYWILFIREKHGNGKL